MAYDKAGRLSKTTDAIGRSVSYEYDEMDNLIRKTATDAKGQKLSYEHDEYKMMSEIYYLKGRKVVYNYDKDDSIKDNEESSKG